MKVRSPHPGLNAVRSMGVHQHGDLGRDPPPRPRRTASSKRAACREYEIHWDTLQKILGHPEPPGYRRTAARPKPKLEAFLPVIHQILEDDRQAPKKQRHTAQRIFERLRRRARLQGRLHGRQGGRRRPGSAVAPGGLRAAVSSARARPRSTSARPTIR